MNASSRIDIRDEFRSEYELTLEKWLRRRFTLFCITMVVLEGTITTMVLGQLARFGSVFTSIMIELAGSRITAAIEVGVPIFGMVVAAWFLWGRRTRLSTREDVLLATNTLIIILGVLDLLLATAMRWDSPGEAPGALYPLLFLHFSACLFMPWTPIESIRPFVPLLLLWAVIEGALGGLTAPVETLLFIIASPIILLPGFAISWLRLRRSSSKFRTELFRQGFTRMRSELAQARSIHESLFPSSITEESFEFDFFFKPMRFMGGDFIHVSRTPENRLRILLLDVTGHGLAAAMTVTRLYGETERIVAEKPSISPQDFMVALNRYVHLTLATHSIYATGIVAELDLQTGELRYANAGHPPAFILNPGEKSERLPGTGIILGAVDSDEFTCLEHCQTMKTESHLMMYTDGAFETRVSDGELLGLDRFEQLLQRNPPPEHWAHYLGSVITGFSPEHLEDDIIIASLKYLGNSRETQNEASTS